MLVTMLGLVQGDGGAANRDGRVLLRYLQSGSLVWTWEDSGPAATFAPSAPKAAFSLAVHAATEKLVRTWLRKREEGEKRQKTSRNDGRAGSGP